MAFAAPNPLLALIAHARAAAAQGAPSQAVAAGPLHAAPAPVANGSGGVSPRDLIGRMIDLGTQAVQAERDPIERESLSRIVTMLHSFAAKEQKDRDAAMGAGPAVKMIRRSQG